MVGHHSELPCCRARQPRTLMSPPRVTIMLDFVRSYLDEFLTGLFLLLAAILTVAHPPHFATPGGLLLARIVLWSAGILVCILLSASRFSLRARDALHFVLDCG